MKRYIYYWLKAFGIDVLQFYNAIWTFPLIVYDYIYIRLQNGGKWTIRFSMPMLNDKNETHPYDKHYLMQDLIVAQRIYERKPERHLDIGSRLDGFITHVASFREIDVFDIRHPDIDIPNVNYVYGIPDNMYDSVSCLHSMEHWGLGRYGDIISINGYRACWRDCDRALKQYGTLYLSVPIGKERIEFNAHRVFSKETIFELAKDSYKLLDYQVLCADTDYQLGLFEFQKIR